MLAPLLLGLFGSLSHCIGMCSAVVFLLERQPALKNNSDWLLAHAGRLSIYSMLGFIGGSLGGALWALKGLQAGLALFFALLAFYMAAAFIGFAPSPERILGGLAHKWGKAMRGFHSTSPWSAYLLGLLWGLLPCGLVLTALVTSVSSSNAISGAINMLVFGLATIPSLSFVKWASTLTTSRTWSRALASMVMMLFGLQFAMRGFASLGLIQHFMIGSIMFW